ncbi:caspase family protein [Vibrio cholerae]|uniref:caspase family protein n=1 Tax=Vibrio cholerae TaxID=666 RepID=UPI001A1F5F8F|nr:caspase family protein [Vibrio cholerae]EGR0683856.1 caspase family protein [Vibrio cholerae]EHD2282548.1 caspase family protein [Vibrio cholerae]EJL6586674.1 caspase family protein [Vibrio cholerae]EJL6629890.1 caspase family protein [Vibrio cholerae]
MNLGIVLAVSDYGNPQNDLPGCDADGKAISTILKLGDKFNDLLVLSENTTSANVKTQLIEFINKYKEQEIEEVIFYYTGHGDFSGKEFYFLLSDFDSSRRKQTTLENAELDNLLKTLGAKVTVKIVDACHSGQAYIKDSAAFDKYLNETKSSFEKCYFMYSSQVEQYSYQDESLSFFTKSIVDAVRKHSSSLIRYKDLIDFVSDSFESNSEQTPFFVVQADFTEPFCTVSKTLRDALSKFIVRDDLVVEKENTKFVSIVDRIKADAERYCTKEEAYEQFSKFVAKFSEFVFDGDLGQLYTCKVSVNDGGPRSPQAIGNWLETSDSNYFAQPEYRDITKSKRVPRKSRATNAANYIAALKSMGLGSNLSNYFEDMSDDTKYETVKYTEKEVSGYKITIDQPAELIEILAEPKLPNISAGKAFIVPLMSKTELRIFYSYAHLTDNGWTDRVIKGQIKWLTKAVPLKNLDYVSLSDEVMAGFSQHLLDAINKIFEVKSKEIVPENEGHSEKKEA